MMLCDVKTGNVRGRKQKVWGRAKALNKGRRFLGLSQINSQNASAPFEPCTTKRVNTTGLSRAGLPAGLQRLWGMIM